MLLSMISCGSLWQQQEEKTHFFRTSSSYLNHETILSLFKGTLHPNTQFSTKSSSSTEQVHSIHYASRVSQEKEKEGMQIKTKSYTYTEEEQFQSYRQPDFRLF